jgi:hypothetical protein
MARTMRTVLRCVASLVLGYLLLGPLGAVYGAARLPVYHAWGILHGGFTTALPALVAAVFVALGAVPWWGKANDVSPRLVACASVLAFVTTLFWADERSDFSLSVWHVLIYVAVFSLFLMLCLRSQRPFLVPLFLVVPLLFDPVFAFLTTVGYGGVSDALAVAGYFARSIPGAVIASGSAAFSASYLRRRGA